MSSNPATGKPMVALISVHVEQGGRGVRVEHETAGAANTRPARAGEPAHHPPARGPSRDHATRHHAGAEGPASSTHRRGARSFQVFHRDATYDVVVAAGGRMELRRGGEVCWKGQRKSLGHYETHSTSLSDKDLARLFELIVAGDNHNLRSHPASVADEAPSSAHRHAPRTSEHARGTSARSRGGKERVHVAYGANGHACLWSRKQADAAKAAQKASGFVKSYAVEPFGNDLPEGAVPWFVEPASNTAPASKPPRKTAAKKTTAKNTAAKKTAPKKAAAKKTAAKKTAAKKTAAKKTAAKETAAKKSAAKKETAAKKSAAKKSAAKAAPASRPANKGAPPSKRSAASPSKKTAVPPSKKTAAPPSQKRERSEAQKAATETARAALAAKRAQQKSSASSAPPPKSGSRPSRRAPAEAAPPTSRSGEMTDAAIFEAIDKALRAKYPAHEVDAALPKLRLIWERGGKAHALAWQQSQGIASLADAFTDWVDNHMQVAGQLLSA